MKRMTTWTVVLLIGVAVIAVYPWIPRGATPAETGFFPDWLIPLGYFIAGAGAAGLYLAWTWKRGVKHD
ncbi:hypothetical protein P1J78_11730 [Psychromarinibacter sp. C21-152]|uniref:Uncharacterized protein n=1 Tax=Psychromarinibacter sediminicola TaxID=3033385 RepID=A0AAE3T9X3_9RHOB|nr:hypothetical protein [Psychromarinibacter sediminicola]MDF0601404.1 hypothetical protein [Psychromarinibacter sediminicola]